MRFFQLKMKKNQPEKNMANAQIICFRATESIFEMINRIMDERMIDRTTIIKMALYHFDTYMRQQDVKEKDLYDIVQDLEYAAAPDQMCFEEFSLTVRERSRML